jgi:hypothetical protein
MKRILVAISALAIAALACGPNFNINVPRLTTGPTETVTISEALPEKGQVADITLMMGAGNLSVSGGADGLAAGTIDYNVAEWKPTLTRDGDALTIEQGKRDGTFGIPENDILNEWDIQLGNDVPLNLTVNAGAYKGVLDLSGLRLKSLSINDGASDSSVTFDEVNPEDMSTLRYATGASQVTLSGLANANFEDMIFKGGAGDYTLDFSGELQRDASVDITTGVCSLRIVVPQGTPVTVKLSGGLSDVKTDGTWTVKGQTYSTAGDGPAITINLDMGVGSLTLVNE